MGVWPYPNAVADRWGVTTPLCASYLESTVLFVTVNLLNQVKEVAQGTELLSNLRSVDVSGGLQLEGFPNRDSTMYKNIYGLEHAHTVLRGTLRY